MNLILTHGDNSGVGETGEERQPTLNTKPGNSGVAGVFSQVKIQPPIVQ